VRSCRSGCFYRATFVVLALGVLAGAAPASVIDLLTQTHRAWGNIEHSSYDQYGSAPQAGTVTAWADDGAHEGWMTASSSTLGSDAEHVAVDADVVSDGPYMVAHQARAEVVYVFRPLTDELVLSFEGAAGFHSFDAGLYYQLEDLTAGTILDERSWEYEEGYGWIDDDLPYEARFDLVLSHQYRLVAGARASAGDMRYGSAELDVLITPEPSVGLLLAVAALGALRSRRQGRAAER